MFYILQDVLISFHSKVPDIIYMYIIYKYSKFNYYYL